MHTNDWLALLQDLSKMQNIRLLDEPRFMVLKRVFDSCSPLRLRLGSQKHPTLKHGLYYENPKAQPRWALSVFRNPTAEGNEVEITVVPERLPLQLVAGKTVENWLNSLKSQLQNLEPGTRPGTLPATAIKIGLKYEAALVFAQEFSRQIENGGHRQSGDLTRGLAQQMMQTVKATCAQSGSSSTVVAKNKEWRFASDRHFIEEVSALLASANGRCALSGVQLDPSGVSVEFLPSLDRKDSTGHYEPGNLQIVARFVNRWKSDMPDHEFMALLQAVRSA